MSDEFYLNKALQEARPYQGMTAPNPAVGALVVKEGEILGMGAHEGCGKPHGEVMAIASAKKSVGGATLYVTLEPCCHQGRTPPCTDLLVREGIGRVVYGYEDPNPVVRGKGAQYLREKGIEVVHLPLPAISAFYQAYAHWWQYGRPWVTAKLAMSLDGCIAGEKGAPVKLTGEEAHRKTHTLRREADALLTSVLTLQRDNPQFNVRLEGEVISKPVLVVDRKGNFPLGCQLERTAQSIILFHGPGVPKERLDAFEKASLRCIEIPEGEGGLDLKALLQAIGSLGYHHVFQETGGNLFSNMIKAQLVQKAYLYIAPQWLGPKAYPAFQGDQSQCLSLLKERKWHLCGEDMMYEMNRSNVLFNEEALHV